MDFLMVTVQADWDNILMETKTDDMESVANNSQSWEYIKDISSNLTDYEYNESFGCPIHRTSGGEGQDYTYQRYILLVSLPIIVLIGTIGNVLSIVVLRRRVMQMSAASFYLIILAFSDLSILYFSALKTWIRMVFGFELMHMSNAACKILKYIFYTSGHLSSWLVVAITIERLVVVRFPFKASQFCSYRQSVRITCVICAVIMLLNVNVLWASELVQYNCSLICSTYLFSPYLYTAYNLSVYSVIPFVLVLTMNLMTILSIVKNNKRFKQQKQCDQHTQISSISKAHRQAPPDVIPPAPSTSTSSKEPELSAEGSAKCSNNKDSTATNPIPKKSPISRIRCGPRHLVQQQQRLTCTLLTITVLWLLLTGPYALYEIVELNDHHYPLVLRIVTYLLMYMNHAINFYIYCLTGRKFRSELRRAFCRKWKPPAYRKVPFKATIPLPGRVPAIAVTEPQNVKSPKGNGGNSPGPNGVMPSVEKIDKGSHGSANGEAFSNKQCKTTKL